MKLVAMMALALVSAASTATAQAAPGDEIYAQPGHLVDAGPTKLNVYCTGSGSPTVVFDAGWEDWSPAWATIQPVIARHTRTCSYDRAGSGFSEAGPMPRTSVEIAKELHAALHSAHIPGPYLLVGHSFGGYTIRTFADLYMPEVYGGVFVDIEDEDVASPKERTTDYGKMDAAVRSLAQCRHALANHLPLPPIPATGHSYSPAPGTPCSHQFFRGLPMKEWSPPLNATVLHIAETRVALYDAAISEMQEMPADADWLVAHRRSFGSRPLRILTAQNHSYDNAKTPPALHKEHLAYEQEHAKTQASFLLLSTDARQTLVPDSGHYIQLDQPQVVIDAILGELPEHADTTP
ncbi:alpha/beta hydrolase [Rhodanobacter sp. DHB23]|uniref:alpha/beta fold hydrolase n=1 Tax=Rhodanobacter sp. DHB23 TaxID=2775923 RepID=UPI0017844C9C|nr:alpha/beta hydrolase [Rhodanobacter sp. DHB23]MBD8874061.1 alpha/beta hydrolase [Rhodanobacter sp. DHB23]